ncbi:tetratricopeptide repeat protein [Streptomyces sp. NPDC088354]|uniref:tetratricopeptide repeat protein n=1 Tax=unclassified Streptomyces TaxID=2593676 RepID=UPI0029A1102A|nr:tetratricopeptide repeat protein [Streptomyces sp. MI02-7b]MDX3073933.1 tetratricopeptide repeat protein [Streptomyces sp. MI02-7b]
MSPQDPEVAAVRRSLAHNRDEPEGRARNAGAERLVAEAEATGDTPLLLDALFNLASAYAYSSERNKFFVPFARLLRMWDERPGDFDGTNTGQLHWIFKWVAGGMLDQPDVPLASIEKWQREMEHRYRLAGHSERAVRQGDFRIARHLGDTGRAQAAFTAWLAADRDAMADCHACELHGQGVWQVDCGQDAEAVATWGPVLQGVHTCAHEPHNVLAGSLLPLVRLGRLDEARAHHLRGYRMVRSMDSMRGAVSSHVEFCALTGNEARALEILAEHPAYFTDTGDPDARMDFLAATALVMRRLVALGHAGRPVPGPSGATWSAGELLTHAEREAGAIAARFDARNGTDAVGRRMRERLDRTPLVDRLPLGVRAQRLATPERPPSAPVPESAAAAPDDTTALLAAARRLTETQHPGAGAAWAALARAAERTGTELDDRARAEIADHAGIDAFEDPGTAVPLFAAAAGLFEAAGDPGEAAACRARAACAAALADPTNEALAAFDTACDALRALHAAGRATPRQLSGALLARIRLRDPGPETEEEVARIVAFAEEYRDAERMASRLADAVVLQARLTASRGDTATAAALFGRAARLRHEAALPWYAAEAEAMLADLALQCDDHATAASSARAALDHGDAHFDPVQRAHLHTVLAAALAAGDRHAEAAEHALEGAHWADEGGQAEGLGAWARLVLGGARLRQGRPSEAATVLETALPDLEAVHHEGRVVQARWWLGESLGDLGEPRAAAEQFLLAAEIAKGWEEQRDHAVLAHLAADCLERAGLADEAVRAYVRAEELWRGLDRPAQVVRTLRARAWITLRDGRGGVAEGRVLMARAVAEGEAALAAATAAGDADEARHLRAELAGTYRQSGELVVRACAHEPGDGEDDGSARAAYEEGLAFADRAVATFDPGDDRSAAQLMAAWLEADLGLPGRAVARAREVLAAYEGREGAVAERRVAEAHAVLEYTDHDDQDDQDHEDAPSGHRDHDAAARAGSVAAAEHSESGDAQGD